MYVFSRFVFQLLLYEIVIRHIKMYQFIKCVSGPYVISVFNSSVARYGMHRGKVSCCAVLYLMNKNGFM